MNIIYIIIISTLQISFLFSENFAPIKNYNDVSEGSLLIRNNETNQFELIPNLHTDVNIHIKGMVAHSRLDQMFINDTDTPIEAVYVFPLPTNSAVNNMVMIVGDRVIQGLIEEKNKAQKTYTKAKKDGKRVSLTEQQRPNIFTNQVANIMPDDTLIVRLEYVNELKYEEGNFNLRFPMVVAPRYIAGTQVIGYSGTGWAKDTDIVPDASKITPHVTPEGMRSGNTIDISINIDAGIPIEKITSSTHSILVKKKNKNNYKINLKNSENIPNKDFTLNYSIKKGDEPKAALFTHRDNNNDYFLLMAVPPVTSVSKSEILKEVFFVVDVSGSMDGTSIEQAKNSLLYSIEKLRPEDSFNIIAFSDHYFRFSDIPLQSTEANTDSAKVFINSLYAGGGTRPMEPLKAAMTMKTDNNKLKMIVFITDGAIGNEKDVFNLVNKHIGNSRLFSVGIGSAPNGHLLEKVSRKGRGTYTYINNINHVKEKMKNLFNKIEMPVLTDVKLELNGKDELYPDPLPDLFINEPLVVFGKINNQNKRNFKAEFSGQTADGYFKISLPVKLDNGIENNAIGDLWARKKISSLMDDHYLGDRSAKNKIIQLSLEHNLMSKFTSFVAVEEKIVNPNGKNSLANIQVDLPEGWVYESVFGKSYAKKLSKNQSIMAESAHSNYSNKSLLNSNNRRLPKTATNMPMNFIFGVIFITLSLGLYFIRRRYVFSK